MEDMENTHLKYKKEAEIQKANELKEKEIEKQRVVGLQIQAI